MSNVKQLSDAIKKQPERQLASRVFHILVSILKADELERLGQNLLRAAKTKKHEEDKNGP